MYPLPMLELRLQAGPGRSLRRAKVTWRRRKYLLLRLARYAIDRALEADVRVAAAGGVAVAAPIAAALPREGLAIKPLELRRLCRKPRRIACWQEFLLASRLAMSVRRGILITGAVCIAGSGWHPAKHQ
jgi:hypothetical protein